MKPKSRDQQLMQRVRYRDRIIVGLFLLLVVAIVGLTIAPHQLDVYQPPDLRYGSLTSAGVVPETTVYSFTESIFDALMTWPEDGEVDYARNSKALSAFFTPAFKKWLKEDYEKRLHSRPNELAKRVSYISVVPGSSYSDKNVSIKNNNSWTVYLDRQITEYIDDRMVKKINVRFPIRVVRWNVSRKYNPWRLAIDGFDGEVTRVDVRDDAETTETDTEATS
ncbi:MAG TPA: TIGR03746 family integrating conjugative element protein [Anaerolineae bacterium]|nr:TIGR03746 family integrating conjugative element protein [Anaerolineae bacterium]